jgi:hypothetical protein
VSRDSRRSADVGGAIRSRVPGSRSFPRKLRERRNPRGRWISSFPGSRLPTDLPGTKKPAEMLGRDIVPAFPLPTGAGGIAGNDTPDPVVGSTGSGREGATSARRLYLADALVRPVASPAESCPDRSKAFPPTLAWRSRPVADLCEAPPVLEAGPPSGSSLGRRRHGPRALPGTSSADPPGRCCPLLAPDRGLVMLLAPPGLDWHRRVLPAQGRRAGGGRPGVR